MKRTVKHFKKYIPGTAALLLCASLIASGCSVAIPGLQIGGSSAGAETAQAVSEASVSAETEPEYSADITPVEGEVEVIQGDELQIKVTYPEKEGEAGSAGTTPVPTVTPALSDASEETSGPPASVTPALIGTASSQASENQNADPEGTAIGSQARADVARYYTPDQETYRTNRFTGIDLETEVQQRLTVDLIEKSEYSRAGNIITDIHAVAVHYLANPGSNAKDNRDYFNSLAQSGAEYASCHFVVGLEGEVIQLIPTNEISLCTNDRNMDTISIECCHPDRSGYYYENTYNSLVIMTAWILKQFNLSYRDIIRHFDANGKICPLAFVKDPEYWYHFKYDVACALGQKTTYQRLLETSNDTFLTEEQIQHQYEEEAKVAEEEARIAAEEEYYRTLEEEGYYEDGEYYEEEEYYEDEYYEDEYLYADY